MILKLFVGMQVVELFGTQEVVSRRLNGGNGVFFIPREWVGITTCW